MNDVTFSYLGRTVLVFGGSKGIGKEVCRQFASAGAVVYNASRTAANLHLVRDLKCDLSNIEDIKFIFSKFEDIDFVINVAGTNLCEPIENIEVTEWDRVMDINLKSFFVICKEAVNLMKKQNYGRIVNVSSIAGRNKSIVSGVHYTSSKYGIIGLTKQLANEVSKHNILVNCVCPSQTMTEMLKESMSEEAIVELEAKIPVRRIATTTEQALPILFLCSSAASYISGATIDINGGQL
jgi:NAD(P)-dependent dehydrogenase (short-subunit alcohol dehydrogenase family)